MQKMRIELLVGVTLLVLLPRALPAQNVVSGAIAGTVRDATGAVLPGVTVEASSPALIERIRAAVTDDQGQYRLVDLRPGVYAVTFTLPGFSALRREGIEITTNFTAPVNAELRLGALEETVTVTGESPTVDVQNVIQRNVLSREKLDSVPSAKSIQAFASLTLGAVIAPGAQDVGGSAGEASGANSFSIHGGPDGTRLLMDGFRFNSPDNGHGAAQSGFKINTGSSQEITVSTNGMSAESETGGIQLNVVPREGGNTFTEYFVFGYSDQNLQGENLSSGLKSRGLATVPPVKRIYDVNPAFGGPIKRDRLWFFTAHRWWGSSQFAPGNYFNKSQDSWFYTPDLSRPAYQDIYNRNNNLRLTWQVTQKNKVNLSYDNEDNCQCYVGILSGGSAPEATRSTRYHPSYIASSSWTYPATNRLLFEAGGALVIWGFNTPRQPGVTPDTISVTESSTAYRYRSFTTGLSSAGTYGVFNSSQTNQRFSGSYVTGSHNFKVGLQLFEGWRNNTYWVNRDTTYTFMNRAPSSVTLWASPQTEVQGRLTSVGLYVQDQWTIKRLTLNIGERFDYLNAWVPEQHFPAGTYVPARDFAAVHDVPNWRDVATRLGAAYDLFGSGKTALKMSLGKYINGDGLALATTANPAVSTVNSANRTWADVNGDLVPQESELGPLSNANFGRVNITTRFDDDLRQGFGKRGYNWQLSGGIQHELRPGIGLDIAYFRTWYGNFQATDNVLLSSADYSPYCITAPADPRLPGGGGNQICGLYDVAPAKFGQTSNLITTAKTFGKQSLVYNGLDVAINARFGAGGQLAGGVSTGRTVADSCYQNGDPSLTAIWSGATGPQSTSGAGTPRTEAYCHVSPPWSAGTQVKLSAVYPLPWGMQASANLQNLPGIPITATYVATNAQIAPSLGRDLGAGARGTVTIDLIPPGTTYEKRLNQLDVRLTKIIGVGRGRVKGMLDVYNLLNASPILTQTTRFGPSWLQPTSILPARLFKFGAQIDF